MDREAVIERLAGGGGAPLHLHLIGVAGSGMSGLAALLLAAGHRVSGSDRVATAETGRLQAQGLAFRAPHAAGESEGADAVVYSSAVRAGNTAFDDAAGRGLPMLRRAEALAALMRGHRGVVVAGTHGKTTTTAMAAHVLRCAGENPSHYVGAEVPVLGRNAELGTGPHFVAEGDESDGTLVAFRPEVSLVLNIESEHLDHYGAGADGLAAIKRVFAQLVTQTTSAVLYCGDDPVATEVCAGAGGSGSAAPEPERVSYGLGESCDFRATSIVPLGQSSTFTVWHRGGAMGDVVVNIPGRHNVLNALAVVALATRLGVPFAAAAEAVGTFSGARRRFETKFRSDRFRVVDDYAHHPTEIAATVAAARGLEPSRVLCVFQPHRFSRTRALAAEFGPAFDGADRVFVTDVYAASEEPLPGVSGQTVVDAINACREGRAGSTPALGDAVMAAGAAARPGDLILVLGAGDVHRVATALASDLATAEDLRAALGDGAAAIRLYEPMSRHTTIRAGGPAQFWVEVATVHGLVEAVRFLRSAGIPVRVVGRGSNLLVRDGGVKGAVIHPSGGEFGSVTVDGDLVTAGAGARLKKVSATAQAAGLTGFEWMEGVPGAVGGALRMNAGAMGRQAFDQVESVTLLTPAGSLVTKPGAEIDAGYRNVPELAESYAVSAVFRGAPAPAGEIAARVAESKGKRKSSQPVAASAGCVFKNPGPVPAGQLVDELGFKGRSHGAAQVSDVHGNFIVNRGGATATDILALIASIRAAAASDRGIELETEVQVIGQDEPVTALGAGPRTEPDLRQPQH